CTPWKSASGCPPAIATTVGTDWTPNACAIRGLASTSTFARTQLPPSAFASFSRTGDSCLQGWHQVAHRSTMTGTCMDRCNTSASKVASVTSMTGVSPPSDEDGGGGGAEVL